MEALRIDRSLEAAYRLVALTTGSEISDLQTLKAAYGVIGGVDPEWSVYRALLTDGTSVVVKATR